MEEAKKTAVRKRHKADSGAIARVGRDEMNLAEFPTAILTTRSNDGVKTLRFRDSHGQLTVTGSDALGLPTPIDTDVLVGLIEMTKKKNNFTESRVNFTRYELIRLIGWANVGSSYERLKNSLDCWAGVLLIYDGCWWDNRLKKYVSKTVHIIENILIAEGNQTAEKDGRQHTLPLSSFDWSEHFMESFQANNLKSLDTEFYFSLNLPTSKQLFRFLDKRFANDRSEWTFNLESLAWEHVGLSRNYSAAKIKEKLGKGIEELEEKGFLKPLPREERYFKTSDGWKIRLIHNSIAQATGQPSIEAETPIPAPAALPISETAESKLIAELVNRKVAEKMAAELVKQHPSNVIAAKIEQFDWEMKQPKPPKKPAGYLIKSICENYAAPPDFVPKAERQRREDAKRHAQQTRAEEYHRKQAEEAQRLAEQQELDAYWQSLPSDEQARLDGEILAAAGEQAQQTYATLKRMAGGGEGFLIVLRRDFLRDRLHGEAKFTLTPA